MKRRWLITFSMGLFIFLLSYLATPVSADVMSSTPGDPATDAAVAAIITILIILLLLQLARQQGATDKNIELLGMGLRPLVNSLLKKIPAPKSEPLPPPPPPSGPIPCQICGGAKLVTCTTCGGKGVMGGYVWKDTKGNIQNAPVSTCVTCRGRGTVTCARCRGSGVEPGT